MKDEEPEYLIDAKYKTLSNTFTGEIDRGDLYEAYAFCRASKVNQIFLAYPATASEGALAGTVKLVSTYNIEDVSVHCVTVSFGSIEEYGGLYNFGQNFTNGIKALLQVSE